MGPRTTIKEDFKKVFSVVRDLEVFCAWLSALKKL